MEGRKCILLICIISFTISIYAQIEDELGPCDPLVPQNCLLPFPNNFWTLTNASTPTGLSLRFSEESFPYDRRGEGIDPAQWNDLDGFSPTPAIMSFFPDLSLNNIPPHKDISLSLLSNCPTILLDTQTLQLIPHWGELDESTPDTTDRAFMMWPAYRLVSGRRYIVAMRGLISTTTGLPIEANEAFISLLYGTPSSDPSITLRQPHYATEVFPLLTQIGVNIDELQLAWDFTVGSLQSVTERLLYMRDDGISRLPANGPTYTITEVIENPETNVARRVKGSFEIPLYTDQKGPGAHLVIGENGLPVFQEWNTATFTINIPTSATVSPGMILIYGHGLFGNQEESNNHVLVENANTYGYVTVATDWWGLSTQDVAAVTKMISENLTDCSIIPDRSQQGILNFIILTKMMIAGPFANDPSMQYNGKSVIDINRIAYNGNSLGGINGITFMAVTQDILQGVMSVPGAPFALALPRSANFKTYFDIIKTRYTNAIDRINLLNIIQLLWDRSDPSGYMGSLTSNPLPDTPEKEIMLQYALGDSQVSWLSALTMGRSINAFMFPDNVREDNEILFGFVVAEEPVATAVIQGYYYGAPNVPQTNIPPSDDGNTHNCPRQDTRAQEAMFTLFTTGKIEDYCNGQCDIPSPPINDGQCNQTPSFLFKF